ncbi:MAG TPA: WD40 repeat domain-containing protein [Pyrinomonadaceae bacterium]|nr:WD40 repeat domain-containing protein [Pyrinomonadaceae bacterium]
MIVQLFKGHTFRFLVLLCLVLSLTGFSAAQRRSPHRTTTGFDDVVFGITFSPDGRTLAVARGASEPSQRFGRIELWDTETGKLRRVIKGFDGPVRSISFSPDGQTIISGSLEYRSDKIQDSRRSYGGMVKGEVKWWDGQSGELKQRITMPGEGNMNFRVTLSPDGKDLIVSETFMTYSLVSYGPSAQSAGLGNLGTPFPSAAFGPLVFFNSDMKLLDATTGEIRTKLNDDQANSIVYSPDGSLLALAQRNEVRLCNPQTGKEEHKLKGFKGRPNAIAFSPDGRLLAVASTNYERESVGNLIKIIGISQVKLFDARTWHEMRKISEIGAVNTLAFSPNSRLLLMGGIMQQGEKELPGVNILNLDNSQLANIPTGEDYTETVDSLSISKDGRLLAFRTGAGSVKILDGKNFSVRQTWDEHSAGDAVERPVSRFLVSTKRVLAVAFSNDGTTVTAETDQGEIKAWDPRTGEVKKFLRPEQNDPASVAVSADGQSFSELVEGKVFTWNSTDTAKQTLPTPEGRSVTAMAMSPDGKRFALGLGNEILCVDASGNVLKTLKGMHGPFSALAFSLEGGRIAGVADNGVVEIWNAAVERLDCTIAGGEVTALRFAPGGQTLVTATADRDINLWNLQTGQLIRKMDKHDATVNAFAFSPDGQLMASGSDDRTAVIWDLASGRSKRTLKGHDQTVSSLAFSPDGKFLASGSGNASVVLWEVRSGKFSRVLR